MNNNVISNEDTKKLENATNQSNLLLQQSLNQIVNGLGSSFVPSTTNEDLLSSQISFLNQSSLQSSGSNSGNNNNQLDNQDTQTRRAITGAHNFNPLAISRSSNLTSSIAGSQQHSPQNNASASALFKQSTFNTGTSNWPSQQPNTASAWSANNQSLLNQPTNQQTQPSLNSWNMLCNNTLNSLSNVNKQQNQPRLSTNLSASSISPLKKSSNSQLIGPTNTTSQQTLLNTQQLNQLSPLSPSKYRQNRPPLMNVNTLNAMLMMQVCTKFFLKRKEQEKKICFKFFSLSKKFRKKICSFSSSNLLKLIINKFLKFYLSYFVCLLKPGSEKLMEKNEQKFGVR